MKMMVTTDASGKFEQHVQPPGRYSVWVTPPAGIKPPKPEPGSDQVRVWTPVYYPGVTLPEAASRIAVHPGDRISGIELKLLAVPAHVVRGMLLNPDGTPAPGRDGALNIDEDPARVPTSKSGPHVRRGPIPRALSNSRRSRTATAALPPKWSAAE